MMWMMWALAAGAAAPRVVEVGFGFTSVYAVDGGDGVVLVDTHNRGTEDKLLRRLERAGVDRARITLIVLTHAHSDHAGSVAALREELGVPVAVGALDVELLSSGEMGKPPVTGRRGAMIAPFVHRHYPALQGPEVVVGDEPVDLGPYGVQGRLRQVGGHTPGAVVVELGDSVVLIGDLIRGRIFRRHTPTLHFVHHDGNEAHRVLGEIVAEPQVEWVWPGHGSVLAAQDVRDWLDDRTPRHEKRLRRLAVD